MRMESVDSHRFAVELTKNDLKKLNITFEDMDYSNIETRRVIWTLLYEARQTLGCDIDPSGKLIIEALPLPDGGCLLQFTAPGASADDTWSRLSSEDVMVYEFDLFKDLISCVSQIEKLCQKAESKLFKSSEGNCYRLIIYPETPDDALLHILSEYGFLCGKGSLCAAVTEEYYNPIYNCNALEEITELSLRG